MCVLWVFDVMLRSILIYWHGMHAQTLTLLPQQSMMRLGTQVLATSHHRAI